MAGKRTEFPRLPVLSSGTPATVAFAWASCATLTATSLPSGGSDSSILPRISPVQILDCLMKPLVRENCPHSRNPTPCLT